MKRFAKLFELDDYQMLIYVAVAPGACNCGRPNCEGANSHIVIQTWLVDNLAVLNVHLPGISHHNQSRLVLAVSEETSRLILAQLQLAANNLQTMQQTSLNIKDALSMVYHQLST